MPTDLFPELSPQVRARLGEVGWTPERDVDISEWIDVLTAEGYRFGPAAEAALRSFGGLTIGPVSDGPNFHNDEPLIVDPLSAGSGDHAFALEVSSLIGGDWFPFGEWLSSVSVYVEFEGRVVAAGMDWIWELGSTVGDAVDFCVRPTRPLRCIALLNPRSSPWPDPEPLEQGQGVRAEPT